MTNIASAYGQNQRGNIQTQAEVGAMMRGVDQQQRQAPVETTAQLVAMLNGLPINLFVGQNQQGSSAETKTGSSTSTTKEKSVNGSISGSGLFPGFGQ
jgi:hypothetical protein